jgi:hypothetical protein
MTVRLLPQKRAAQWGMGMMHELTRHVSVGGHELRGPRGVFDLAAVSKTARVGWGSRGYQSLPFKASVLTSKGRKASMIASASGVGRPSVRV